MLMHFNKDWIRSLKKNIPSEKFMIWNLDLKLKSLAYGSDHKLKPCGSSGSILPYLQAKDPGRTL